MAKTAKDLRDERQVVFTNMEKIWEEASEVEGRKTLDTDDEKRYKDFEKEFDALSEQIERTEVFEKRKAEMIADTGLPVTEPNEESATPEEAEKEFEEKRTKAFDKWLVHGKGELNDEERTILKSKWDKDEKRAQTVGTDAAGGYTVPTGHSRQVEIALADYISMINVARVWRTSTGNEVNWPTMDDTSNKGRLLAEMGDSSAGTTDLTLANKVFSAYKYTSDLLQASAELLQDNEVGFDGIIASALGERLGRIFNEHSTTGTGSAQPQGVVGAAATGVTSGAATVIDRDDILSLIHTVDPAYRRSSNARLMFNDATLAAIRKLAFGAGDARPLYQVSPIVGEPDRLEGEMFTINQDMANIATTAVAMVYGDFNKFVLRISRDVSIRTLTERYAELDAVAYVGFMRFDSELLADNAIKKLTQA